MCSANLAGKSVVAQKLLCEEKQRVLFILHSISPRNAGINPMYSQAESTIRSHTNTSKQSRPSRPLVIEKERKSYPMNPTINYISRFADWFRGCLGFGSVAHLFRECPEKNNKEIKYFFSLGLECSRASHKNKRGYTHRSF